MLCLTVNVKMICFFKNISSTTIYEFILHPCSCKAGDRGGLFSSPAHSGSQGLELFQVNNGQKIRKHLGHVVLYREEHTHTHTHTYTIRG